MVSSELLEEFGFEEEKKEIASGQHAKTGFPKPRKSYELVWQVYDLSLEEPYFWVVDVLKEYVPIIEKLEDSFAAAENSAFFGVTQQRLGAQQDKISQFLATVGKMIKELFQMVRELRIIDERITYYGETKEQLTKDIAKRSKSAEITLKGMFVDLVQGGAKSAASVFGMARELEFITLPDLFFDAPPFRNFTELDDYIISLEKDFNLNVLRVLQRHLRQFMEWKKRTHVEHENRRRFMLQYLLQHFEIIKMYIAWIKPYLRHVSRLTLNEKRTLSADIVSAFEGSMLDVEILARKRIPVGKSGANGCVLITFNYRTRPEMKVVQEGYQRGPVHVGKFQMHVRVYGWTDEQVAQYKKLKEKETLLLMGDISASVQQAMESLGAELDQYLAEARGEKSKEKEKEEEEELPQKSLLERFFGDFYTPKRKKRTESKKTAKEVRRENEEIQKLLDPETSFLMGHIERVGWYSYHNFKKAHRMIAW